MARITNPKIELANEAISYIQNELKYSIDDFVDELNKDSKLDPTYVSARDGSAKTHLNNAMKMLKWLCETEFGLTAETPYTDTEVDSISINLRTIDDGI